MADFSHLSVPSMYSMVRRAERGGRLTDEMLRDVVRLLPSSVLGAARTKLILAELDVNASRKRGRPVGNVSTRRHLAQSTARITHSAFPSVLQDQLVRRLESGKRFTDFELAAPIDRYIRKRRRDMYARMIYREVYRLLGATGPVSNLIIGPIPLRPTEDGSRSHRALLTTQDVLRERLGYPAPAISTLRNIVGPSCLPG